MNPVKAVVYTYYMYKHANTDLNDLNSLSAVFLKCDDQSGKPGTIRESNQASGVSKAHYA